MFFGGFVCVYQTNWKLFLLLKITVKSSKMFVFLYYPSTVIKKCLFIKLMVYFLFFILFIFLFVVNFAIHWNETAMGLHVFPIPIPPPTSLSTGSL